MNDDKLNYRFRLISFDDNGSVNEFPEVKVDSIPEEPKPPKYSLSADVHSDAGGAMVAEAAPPPARRSQSNTGITPKKTWKSKVLKNPRNNTITSISAKDFNQIITSEDNMYPDKLVDEDDEQITTADKNTTNKRKTQNQQKWQKDVKVIYTSETTKIPRRRKIYQPPNDYAYRTNESLDHLETLYRKECHQKGIFKNNPAVYFQSSGDCRRDCRGIFGKMKKSREKGRESCNHHFHVANMGDCCEGDQGDPPSYDCTHLPHLNVVGFPLEKEQPVCLPQTQGQSQSYQGCPRSLNTLHFDDVDMDHRFKSVCSQPCPRVSHTYECETGPKTSYGNEPTAKISESKATTKKTSAKLCCQPEEESKDKQLKKKKKKRSSKTAKPKKEKTSNGFFKNCFFGLAVIIFFPCVLLYSFCWLVTYPLRSSKKPAPILTVECPDSTNAVRKPRERNLCHLNRAPKMLANSMDNWCAIKDALTCACKSALPSCQIKDQSRSCSPEPCLPPQCSKKSKKSKKSKVTCKKGCNVNLDACPIKIPPCAIKSCGQRHPDTSQQYRMFYGGALRGWLMKPLNCYGVTCSGKAKSCRNVCPTVMPVKTDGNRGIPEKKVKFNDEKGSPMPKTTQPRAARKGAIRPCTEPRRSKKPCRVCCETIKPELDPTSVGLVHYGKDDDETGKKKKKKGKKKKEGKKKKKEKTGKLSTKAKKKGGKNKKKKKKKKKKGKNDRGLVQSIRDAEREAWGDEPINCDEIWIRTLRKKPCFWVYKKFPGLYPCFLQWHSCFTNCFTCCVMCLSTIVWCPLLIFVFICMKLFCKK